MSRFRCNVCQGEYDDILSDGMIYFHVCPPITVVVVRLPSGEERELPLGDLPTLPPGFEEVRREVRPRPGARDENVVATREELLARIDGLIPDQPGLRQGLREGRRSVAGVLREAGLSEEALREAVAKAWGDGRTLA
jgi:hypothetical protein